MRKKTRLSLQLPKYRKNSTVRQPNKEIPTLQTGIKRVFSKSPYTVKYSPSPKRGKVKGHSKRTLFSPTKSPFKITYSPSPKKGKTKRALYSQHSPAKLQQQKYDEWQVFNSDIPLIQNIENSDFEMNVGTLPLYTHMSMQPDTTSLDTHLGDSHKCVTSDASTSTEKENFDKLTNELINLAPYVMEEMSESDVGADVLVQFFKLVVEKKFPLSNTSFLLWCDVVKWYNCKTTVNMRYSEQTKLFWKLGWRLFGGRFIHFMSGYKNQGDKVKHGLSTYIPEQSEINFAVPDENILRYYDPYRVNGEREPGIFEDIISVLGKNLLKKSSCLTYDGKKLKQGLSKGSGDVDLMGFEEGESLKEKREHLLKRETSINEIMTSIGLYGGNIQKLPELLKAELKEVLLHALKELSINIFQLKEIKTKKEYCKAKLIERGGDTDWRKGRYVYAISAVIAFIYDIDNFLSAGRELTQTLSIFISYINGVDQIKGNSINLETSPLHQCLDDDSFSNTGENSRYLKQKSVEWFALRKKARITGSTFYSAVGCDGLNRQKDHFEKVICGIEGKEPSDFTKKAMQHGTDNENNGVATIVGILLPVLYPDLKFYEEGCIIISSGGDLPFMIVSPDGSLRKGNSLESSQIAIEIKCPINQVHTRFPPRYLLQCLSEIESMDVDSLLYISWTKEDTTVFKVDRDQDLFGEAMNIAMNLYGEAKPKKPTKLSDDQKELKKKIVQKSKEIELIGRFPSLVFEQVQNVYHRSTINVNETQNLLSKVKNLINTHYQLKRERASEAMVFLVADLDRSWEKDELRCAPVSWFPRGHSLSTENLRNITEQVHTLCHREGIHIPCQSFDGQWHGIVTRNKNGQPLTVFQLQKDTWKETEQMKKADIVSLLRTMNKVVHNSSQIGPSGRIIELSNGNIRLPRFPVHLNSKRIVLDEVATVESITQATLADVIPESVKSANNLDDRVLALTSVEDQIEIEAFAVNVFDDEWENELDKCQDDLESVDIESHVEQESDSNQQLTSENKEIQCESNDNSSKRKISQGMPSSVIQLSINDMNCLLAMFKTTKDCNKKGKWDNTSREDLLLQFSSIDKLRLFLDVELRSAVRYLKKTKECKIKESSTKGKKLEELAALLNINFDKEISGLVKKKKKPQQVKSLSELATQTIQKLPKLTLNVIHAELIWQNRYDNWISKIRTVTVNGMKHDWFYKPDFSEIRNQYEVRCIDATHLLTRTRTKVCKGGIEGLTNESWLKVARSGKTLLTPAMIQEIIDPMSMSMAITHFSPEVENMMRSNGDIDSANLCHDIRYWWQADDTPGIESQERQIMREGLRRRLLSYIDFRMFPPKTMYVNGWPSQLWEALLASIDAKIWLYALCHGSTYNVRAFSSMVGETFFSEVTQNDRRGHGTVSCQEFGQFIGNTIEQVQIRLDPERQFSYSTKRKTMYNLVEETFTDIDTHHVNCRVCLGLVNELPLDITFRNHTFDSAGRKRLNGRKREATISTDRNALCKGELGIRWEKARCNQAKLLPTVKMGIE